jgi:hypothetical protein
MEFVPHPTFPSQMLVGPRVADDTAPAPNAGGLKDVLVTVAKGTFQADPLSPATGSAPPGDPPRSAAQQELLLKDELFDPTNGKHTRREHDLALFKPRADLVLLGAPAPPPAPPAFPILVGWTEEMTVGATVMRRTFTVAPPLGELHPLTTFGWQPRTEGWRKGYAGQGLDDPSYDPTARKLPVAFSNLFLNGGWYGGGTAPLFGHLAPGARIRVQARGTFRSGATQATSARGRWLRIPASAPVMRVTFRSGARSVATQQVPMRADTVVYRKDEPSFYVVWRGSWDIGSVTPRERYVRVEVV